MQKVGDHKVRVLAHDDLSLLVGKIRDHQIPGSIAVRKIASVPGFMTSSSQGQAQRSWKLRVEEKLHAAIGSSRLTRLILAA